MKPSALPYDSRQNEREGVRLIATLTAAVAIAVMVFLIGLASARSAVAAPGPTNDASVPGQSAAQAAATSEPGDAQRGRKLAFDRSMGNCLACHTMKGSDVPSNVGPELKDLKARFPDPKMLFAILWDEESRNPQTVMPPFGKNLILNAQQINDVVAFLYAQ